MCLVNNRFRVSINYKNPYSNPPGQVGAFVGQRLKAVSDADTATFGFADPTVVEVVVRISDARPAGAPRFDIYYGGLTDVEYTVSVTDTQSGRSKQYTNKAGTVGGGQMLMPGFWMHS